MSAYSSSSIAPELSASNSSNASTSTSFSLAVVFVARPRQNSRVLTCSYGIQRAWCGCVVALPRAYHAHGRENSLARSVIIKSRSHSDMHPAKRTQEKGHERTTSVLFASLKAS